LEANKEDCTHNADVNDRQGELESIEQEYREIIITQQIDTTDKQSGRSSPIVGQIDDNTHIKVEHILTKLTHEDNELSLQEQHIATNTYKQHDHHCSTIYDDTHLHTHDITNRKLASWLEGQTSFSFSSGDRSRKSSVSSENDENEHWSPNWEFWKSKNNSLGLLTKTKTSGERRTITVQADIHAEAHGRASNGSVGHLTEAQYKTDNEAGKQLYSQGFVAANVNTHQVDRIASETASLRQQLGDTQHTHNLKAECYAVQRQTVDTHTVYVLLTGLICIK